MMDDMEAIAKELGVDVDTARRGASYALGFMDGILMQKHGLPDAIGSRAELALRAMMCFVEVSKADPVVHHANPEALNHLLLSITDELTEAAAKFDESKSGLN